MAKHTYIWQWRRAKRMPTKSNEKAYWIHTFTMKKVLCTTKRTNPKWIKWKFGRIDSNETEFPSFHFHLRLFYLPFFSQRFSSFGKVNGWVCVHADVINWDLKVYVSLQNGNCMMQPCQIDAANLILQSSYLLESCNVCFVAIFKCASFVFCTVCTSFQVGTAITPNTQPTNHRAVILILLCAINGSIRFTISVWTHSKWQPS